MNEMGSRLKHIRKKRGFTQKQVANYLGISQGQLARLENGSRRLRKVSMLEQLCLLYNIDEDWLLYGEGQSPKNKKLPHICQIEDVV